MDDYRTDIIIKTGVLINDNRYSISTYLTVSDVFSYIAPFKDILREIQETHRIAIDRELEKKIPDTPTDVPTVYSTLSSDGVMRMALYPMDNAPPYCPSICPNHRFPFRVIYSISGYVWKRSCRGKDFVGIDNFFAVLDSGIAWLVKGGWE